ncbi:MAG: DUF2121 domain-containing protein [Methanothrix harundinacea]|jgi:hypothetical protein|nr:DUF2121 domain-containing protein [Methanothrix harundinacea]
MEGELDLSLVVGFAGKKRAILGGDRRSIVFFGGAEALEEELYDGKIRTDEELKKRAEELGSVIQIADGREKVWKRNDGKVLVGEVTELSASSQRRRRVYLTPGGYILVEISGKRAEVSKKGKSTLIILGNKFTRELAYRRLGSAGKPPEISSMKALFEEARRATATISPDYTLLSSDEICSNPEAVLLQALREDCEERGWELFGLA